MKGIHNIFSKWVGNCRVETSHANLQKWKEFTTLIKYYNVFNGLRLLTRIYKNERNSQRYIFHKIFSICWDFSREFTKMKGIHNNYSVLCANAYVETSHANLQKWKEFTTIKYYLTFFALLRLLTRIYKNERNSQHFTRQELLEWCWDFSREFTKMKGIHNDFKVLKRL